jgi:hypothetical protein
MQLFSAKIRLGGSLLNEVSKIHLTVPEVLILRLIHGEESVIDLAECGKKRDLDEEDERRRLKDTYGAALAKLRPAQTIEGLFGQSWTPLPAKMPGGEHKKTRADSAEEALA